jgi:hypothetical protein
MAGELEAVVRGMFDGLVRKDLEAIWGLAAHGCGGSAG